MQMLAYSSIMRTYAAPLIALAALASCATDPPAQPSSPHPPSPVYLVYTAIGESAFVDGPRVKPLAIIEDSRCPTGTQCIWPGRVRLRVEIILGSRTLLREITQHEPISVADGTLELVDVKTLLRRGDKSKPLKPSDYSFGFRFMGGL